MHVDVADTLDGVPAADWDRLSGTDNPFLRHGFLHTLEETGCVAPERGWQPSHLLLRDDGGRLLAAAPAYLKGHSRGEFVFDWSWAEAYHRFGQRYYPKLVMAVPFTPATGPRLLLAEGMDRGTAADMLAEAGRQLCRRQGLSSMHWLFPDTADGAALARAGLSTRIGCQFHWHNAGYRDFDDFLSTFSSKKRKNVRRERRQAAETGLRYRIVPGDAVPETDWHEFHDCFRRTFLAYGNRPPLNEAFFRNAGERLGGRLLMVQARDTGGRLVAAALLFRGATRLYGRYWGCREELPGVHFETCFYQGIDYCIREGLECFEPGAQGEHKIARGFLPVETRSCHWLADAGFHHAVEEFLGRETPLIREYMDELTGHSPYRAPPEPAFPPVPVSARGGGA